jgi:uncharacterized membrane protein YbaN (DUF454 family)
MSEHRDNFATTPQARMANIDAVVERYCVSSSPLRSRLYVALGSLFVFFALVGVWVPGWPTISWAVPAAFLFSMSSERLFRWCLSNRFFGPALFDYYATGRTIPRHAKLAIVALIALASGLSAWLVFKVSYPADPGYGPSLIVAVGLVGMWYVGMRVATRA